MSLRTAFYAAPIALALAASFAVAAPEAAPAAGKTFEQQLDGMLANSRDNKRGLVFHIKGQSIPGVVKEISGDAVVAANQEHGRILIRREWIDAVEGD